jgi:hypothetical protein
VNAGLTLFTNLVHTSAADDSFIPDIDPDWKHSWCTIQVASGLPAITHPELLTATATARVLP